MNITTHASPVGDDLPDPFATLNLPESMARDLQSDHAGETGAVYIYHGVLALSRDPEVIEFARHHLDTEQQHLAFFEQWLPRSRHSALIPVWRLAGWLLGAVPALFGPRAVFTTIAAVETFVEGHYQAQLDELVTQPEWAALRRRLQAFCDDEVAHRDDATDRLQKGSGVVARVWAAMVDTGSHVGVFLARRL